MNLIQRMHRHVSPSSADNKRPAWIRFYDPLVHIVTGGKAKTIRQLTLDLATLQPGQRVLDVGCGTGDLTLAASQRVGATGEVVGIDIEPGMINQAQAKMTDAAYPVIFQLGSMEKIAYADGTFDVAFSSLMLHHLSEVQKEQGLRELYRVLKPNGRLVIVDLDPSQRGLITRFPGHSHLAREDYIQARLPRLLQQAGFTAVQTGKHRFRQLSYATGEKQP